MDLFNTNSIENILPFEGEVLNYGLVLDSNLSAHYFNTFLKEYNYVKNTGFLLIKKL